MVEGQRMIDLELDQVWVCAAAVSMPPLMCIIGRLDQFSETGDEPRIVSVSVMPHPEAVKSGWQLVSQMPIYEDAFRSSGLRLVQATLALGPDFESGYAIWLTAFQEGRASVFSMTVSEAYAAIVSIAADH